LNFKLKKAHISLCVQLAILYSVLIKVVKLLDLHP
jgi:hypothetical protein